MGNFWMRMRYHWRRRRTPFAALAVLLTTEGCALDYVDANGQRHVIGLVALTIADAGDNSTFAGNVVTTSVVGLSVANSSAETDVSVGYSQSSLASLRDNAAVLGNPLDANELSKPAKTNRGGTSQ